ncbi:MAG TPA: tripartite tricarboxylate transporter substrate-binding protein [Burkholderiaceae bacterium]|nr:tripartite tricarboxylate transporter substrate-binding protein [Burkholderiaceae bacterium]
MTFPITRRAAIASALALPAAVRAQARAITLVVPFGPGGIADLTARAVAQEMAAILGQPIVVDNKPSAGAIVGAQQVARAAPDGTTLLLMSNANAVSAGLFRKLPFDVQRDFAPVTTLGFFDLALFVGADSPLKSVDHLLRRARAQPGRLTFGTIAAGSTQHLAAEYFKSVAGIDAVVVPYKGTPAVITALRAGEIDVGFEILGPMLGQVQAKVLRALAVTSDRRFAGLPDVPTVKESGLAGYNVASWNALAAPAATPRATIDRLNRAALQALAMPSVRQQLQALGVRAQGGTPEAMRQLLGAEIKRWSAVIVQAKIETQ